MSRAYLSLYTCDIDSFTDDELLGRLADKLPFSIEIAQKNAWSYQIRHLRELARELPGSYACMEFLIPRMGRRVDLVLLFEGIIFVIEYKIGSYHYDQASLSQVYGYGLDLKNFHDTSHLLPIVPILVATNASFVGECCLKWDYDRLAQPLKTNASGLASTIQYVCKASPELPIDVAKWGAGQYRPTPTIVEAAQALYRGHSVQEISRSEAGARNLTHTTNYVSDIIEIAKNKKQKVICFITGVPGSGKTLAGLNLATSRQRNHSDEHAVFLSGNGPLVDVLRESLAQDAVMRSRETKIITSKTIEYRRASSFIQNIHHFRDYALESEEAPVEKVVVFDEAQRAWDLNQTSKFTEQKKGKIDFSMSEPEFLISVMDRHQDWCAIICLVGGGQEINTGEAGIDEWLRALTRIGQHWQVHISPNSVHSHRLRNESTAPALHLTTSLRSFRAEQLSDFIGHIIAGNASSACQMAVSRVVV